MVSKAFHYRIFVSHALFLFYTSTLEYLRKTEPTLDEIIFETQEDSDIYHAVLELPLKYRTVIQLYYYEDMNLTEISKALGIKESTIKSQLHRVRNLLRKRLKGEYEDV